MRTPRVHFCPFCRAFVVAREEYGVTLTWFFRDLCAVFSRFVVVIIVLCGVLFFGFFLVNSCAAVVLRLVPAKETSNHQSRSAMASVCD